MPPKGDSLLFLANSWDAIEQKLQDNAESIEAIYLVIGPGALTGVRVGVGFATSLAYGLSLPVMPISSLQLSAYLAHARYHVNHCVVLRDARMGEYYYGEYQLNQQGISVVNEGILPHDQLHTLPDLPMFLDPCAKQVPDHVALLERMTENECHHALDYLAQTIASIPALAVKPIYWRPSVLKS